MIKPSYDEVMSIKDEYDVIPVYKEVYADSVTPITLLRKILQKSDKCFLLESIEGGVKWCISGIQIFLLYFIAMFGTIWLWSICSVILCTLLRNMWAGIGCLFGIVIGLISKAGSSFFTTLSQNRLFSFSLF